MVADCQNAPPGPIATKTNGSWRPSAREARRRVATAWEGNGRERGSRRRRRPKDSRAVLLEVKAGMLG